VTHSKTANDHDIEQLSDGRLLTDGLRDVQLQRERRPQTADVTVTYLFSYGW